MARIRSLCFVVLALLGTLGTMAALSCGGGGGGGYGGGPTAPPPPTGTPPPSSALVIVQVNDDSYSPKSITIQPGDTVRWVLNGNSFVHTVTAKDGSFDSGSIFTSKGAMYEHRFDAKGTFEYACKVHGNCCLMRGSVLVGSDASPPPDPSYE
jgi:plastocyanin